jgi:MerR family redox-sensitive transcriptional activator SoxR
VTLLPPIHRQPSLDGGTSIRDRLDGCIGCGCLSLKSCRQLNPGDQAAALGPGPRYLLGDD